MTKQEFLDNVNSMLPEDKHLKSIPECIYKTIEKVYLHHPSIDATEGKKQIAELYVRFGFSIIMDMEPRANRMVEMESRLLSLNNSVNQLRAEMDLVRDGARVVEIEQEF